MKGSAEVKFQAHKGVSSEYPENTMPAYEAAVQQGYDIIELDLGVTKDQVFVMLHDDTINRVARYKDGQAIEKEIRICDITYEEALQYDYGIGKAMKYRGTRMASLEEVLRMAVEKDIRLKIDNKYQKFTKEQRVQLLDTLKSYTDLVSMTCNTVDAVAEARQLCPGVGISYDGPVSEEVLKELSVWVPKEQLTVWLPIKNANTWWVSVEYANPVNAAMIRKYASLGVWILSCTEELQQAESLGADVIETNGQLKPLKKQGILTDLHTHSEWSHDSVCPVMEMGEAQIQQGVQVMAVTDHCDVCLLGKYEIFEMTQKSVEAAAKANDAFAEKLKVLKGMEICENFWYPKEAEELTRMCDYDVIIGSIHSVLFGEITKPYSAIDFSRWDEETIHDYLRCYFRDVNRLLDTQDMDILAHLTCPLRYIVGKYNRNVDLTQHEEAIRSILQRIIKMGIALEVNTSSLHMLGDTMPGHAILKMYKELGGYLITIGSDAHVSENAAYGIQETIPVLQSLGYENLFYYEKRKSIACSIG